MNINKLFEGQRHDEKKISKIAQDIEDKWEACGLTNGIYEEFASIIAKQYAEHFLVKFLDNEIERLEKYNDKSYFINSSVELTTEKIAYLQDIKRQLTESK